MNGFIAGTVFIWPAGGHGGIQPPAVWVCASYPGKLYSSVEAQTFCREEAPAGVVVCALESGKPYFSVEGRKLFAGKSRRRPREFAPHTRESLILPLRGANFLQGRGAGVCVSLRPTPGKALFFRRGAQTFYREKPPAAMWVCASFLGKPYSTIERRKPFAWKSPRRLCEFAPHTSGKPYSTVEGRKPVSREPARSWCTEPRKALIFRFRCTKS